MYLFKRGLLPNYFRDMFTLASQIHSHKTRNSSLLYIPYYQTNLENSQFGFKVLSFSTRLVAKFKTVKVSVCLAHDLKNSFRLLLSESNILFVELHTFLFRFFL